MYSFLLTLSQAEATLTLQKDGSVVATKTWAETRDMGRQLFEAIQGLLGEAGLKPTDISDFRVETTVSDNFTPLDSQAARDFWSTKHTSPGEGSTENDPLISDLTGLTSVKIAETVAKTFNFAVSEAKK